MASTCKCDACGKLFKSTLYIPNVTIDIDVYTHPYDYSHLDLCLECQEKLENFIHYKENFCNGEEPPKPIRIHREILDLCLF